MISEDCISQILLGFAFLLDIERDSMLFDLKSVRFVSSQFWILPRNEPVYVQKRITLHKRLKRIKKLEK